jgi:hypothetical protein
VQPNKFGHLRLQISKLKMESRVACVTPLQSAPPEHINRVDSIQEILNDCFDYYIHRHECEQAHETPPAHRTKQHAVLIHRMFRTCGQIRELGLSVEQIKSIKTQAKTAASFLA